MKILTKNGVYTTNIDDARNFNFNAGRRSGILKGALNGGNFFSSSNNTIALDTCELRLCGHRIVIDEVEYRTLVNKPSSPVRYSLIAEVMVDDDSNVLFNLFIQSTSTTLIQDNLDINGKGKFQLEIGRFTQLSDGTIADVVRTADLITGSGLSTYDYIRIGDVTTNKISPELDADIDIENVIDETDGKPKTNFTFNLPTPTGTVVNVGGEEQSSLDFSSDPQSQIDNISNNMTKIKNEKNGFSAGDSATANGAGSATGESAFTLGGGAVGSFATSDNGGAVGDGAYAWDGGAVGKETRTKNGFAGGSYAKTMTDPDNDDTVIDAVQLGTGTNTEEKTLKVYDYTLMNADGTIPLDRMVTNDNVTSWQDKLDVGKLIAEYNVTTASNSITVSGLDIQPNETYDVYLTGTSSGADMFLKINDIATGYHFMSVQGYSDSTSATVGKQLDGASLFVGGFWEYANRIKVEIYNMGGACSFHSENIGIASTIDYYRVVDGLCLSGLSSDSAITKLEFTLGNSKTFNVGATVKIYKR